MEKLFGLEMATIAGCLTSALLLVVGCLALLAWRRPVMFKLGLRPIPRRRAQSTLIVLGLMLATLIITAAFVTGDTLSSTIRALALEGMGEIDETVEGGRGQATSSGSAGPGYFRIERHTDLAEQLAGYDLIDHVFPAINDTLPVVNATQRRSLRSIGVFGLRPEDIDLFVPHQANLRIIEAVGQRLGISSEKTHLYIEHCGNTSSASIPLALEDASRQKRLRVGERILLASFGAGFTWGAALLRG